MADSDSSRKLARQLAVEIEDLFQANDLATIDQRLKGADFAKMSVHEASSLIRATSRAKANLIHWTSALRRLSIHLKKTMPARHDSLLIGLTQFLNAKCAVLNQEIRTWKCPLEKGKCLWQNRQTNECCHLEQDLTVDQYCDLTGADQVTEVDVDEFRARLRASIQL